MVESVASGGRAGVPLIPRARRARRAEGAESDVQVVHDAVVIGGGPAGATAARLLASWGHGVVLLVRRPARSHLAESLPPSCARLLEHVGAGEAVDRAGFMRSTGNTVWWGTGRERVERFGGEARGYQVDRGRFDRVLVDAAERAGAIVYRDATVSDVTRSAVGESVASVPARAAGRVAAPAIRARWTLDCTGRAGLLARRPEWGRRQSDAGIRTMAIAGIWERPEGWGLDDETHTLVESYDEGWGWSVPTSRTRRCVALMVDPGRTALAKRRTLADLYALQLRRAARFTRLVDGARLVGQPWVRDASPYCAERVAGDGTMLVGDAASFVDPLSSYGVKKALSSAWLAAVVVRTCVASDALRAAALSLFESRERAMYEALRRGAAEMARQAEGAHGAGFWDAAARLDVELREPLDEPDVAVLRRDGDVLAAFEKIRGRASLRLTTPNSVRRVHRPTVRDQRVVLEEQLAAPAFERGVRYLRNVDLVKLVELAPAHDQVPDLYQAYHRAVAPRTAPVPLPDFLGALSVLVGKGLLDLA